MLNLLIAALIGATLAIALCACYHPGFVKDRRRICHVCGKQIVRGHRWHLHKGKAQHYYCDEPTLSPGLAAVKATIEAARENEVQ